MSGKREKVRELDYQKRTVDLLEELVKWTKFSSFPQVRQVLLDILPADENKIAYQYSDGRKSKDIAELANVDDSTIRDWGKIWVKVHIAEFKSVKGGERAIRLFSLEDFGIDIPKLKASKPNKPASEQSQHIEDLVAEKNDE
jgi:hypothetical protein